MIDIRRGDDRFHTRLDWLDSHHSFSFGPHYDPTNVGHGLLLVSNDDIVGPGAGFGTHPHRDMEIVTWVLDGRLEHRDSEGNHGVLRPGLAQRMSAGTGIRHSEANPSPHEALHFLQMWVPPDRSGVEPSYEQRDVTVELEAGGLVPVASGSDRIDAAIRIHQRDATMFVAALGPDERAQPGPAGHHHVFVAEGSATVDGHGLEAGDAARLTDGSPELVGGSAGAQLVVWATA